MVSIANNNSIYEISGTSGPVVVLIHGLGVNRHMWKWQIHQFAQKYQVVTYDLFGHGDSPFPHISPSLSLYSSQLRELLDELDIRKVAVVGFSLGGMIARRFAMDFRDCLWALSIVSSPHRRTKEARAAVQTRVDQAKYSGPESTVEDALIRWFSEDFREQFPDHVDLVRQWVVANDRNIYPSLYQVLVDGVDELIAPEPKITCPTLVMTGDQDYGNPPAMSAAIAEEIPGSVVKILPGLRHMAMIEAPEHFNREVLTFLSAHEPI